MEAASRPSVSRPGRRRLRLAVAFGSLAGGEWKSDFSGRAPVRRCSGPLLPEQIRALTLPAEAGEPGVSWSPVVSGDTAGMEIFVPTGLERSLSSRFRVCRTRPGRSSRPKRSRGAATSTSPVTARRGAPAPRRSQRSRSSAEEGPTSAQASGERHGLNDGHPRYS